MGQSARSRAEFEGSDWHSLLGTDRNAGPGRSALYELAEEGVVGLAEQEVSQGPRVVADHGQQDVHCFQLQLCATLLHHDGQHLRGQHAALCLATRSAGNA